LLNIFPHDAKDKDGNPFWSGPKRAPSPVFFNPHDTLHASFVASCANLIAFNLGIPQNRDINAVAQMAASVNVPVYKPKQIKVELPGQQNQNQEENKQEEVAPEDEQILD